MKEEKKKQQRFNFELRKIKKIMHASQPLQHLTRINFHLTLARNKIVFVFYFLPEASRFDSFFFSCGRFFYFIFDHFSDQTNSFEIQVQWRDSQKSISEKRRELCAVSSHCSNASETNDSMDTRSEETFSWNRNNLETNWGEARRKKIDCFRFVCVWIDRLISFW